VCRHRFRLLPRSGARGWMRRRRSSCPSRTVATRLRANVAKPLNQLPRASHWQHRILKCRLILIAPNVHSVSHELYKNPRPPLLTSSLHNQEVWQHCAPSDRDLHPIYTGRPGRTRVSNYAV
jgi:hypothetical protein